MTLAVMLHTAPADIDRMPYVDSLMMLHARAQQQAQERRWQAAIHGRRIR